jgi:RNA polymerase sigma factor (sigma-70 family)
VEVSALRHSGVAGRHGRSPLLRLQSDERLIALMRRGSEHAFEALVGRYQSRLLGFCRHMLGSREDAEDVLQEVFAAAFNAIHADERPLNVRPWLYRIARNRSLNHLRRTQSIAVDSMDAHYSENGKTTADKVQGREDFRHLVADIHLLPETQRTALLLREMEALSYEQIAEAMDTTVPSVKSLLVRARVSLAEAAEARLLSCEDVRLELGEVAEGLRRRVSPPGRRHLRTCDRCTAFRSQLRQTNKALAAIFPVGPLLLLKKLALAHFGTSATAGAGGGATAAGTAAGTVTGTAAGSAVGAAAGSAAGAAATGGAAGAAAAGSAAGAAVTGSAAGAAVTGSAVGAAGVSSAAGGIASAGAAAVASKAAAGMAAAALMTAGAVEVNHVRHDRLAPVAPKVAAPVSAADEATKEAPKASVALADAAKDGAEEDRGDKDGAKPGEDAEAPTAATAGPALGGTPTAPGAAPPGSLRTETGSDTTTLPTPAPPTHIQTTPARQPQPSPPAEPAPIGEPEPVAPSSTGSGGLAAPPDAAPVR